MVVYVFAETARELAGVRDCLRPHADVRAILLTEQPPSIGPEIGHAVIHMNPRRELGQEMTRHKPLLARARHRSVLVPDRGYRSMVQAHALMANSIYVWPDEGQRLIEAVESMKALPVRETTTSEVAEIGACRLSSLFLSVAAREPMQAELARATGPLVINALREDGLDSWLSLVRSHHEGTYQHCLLVMGLAVDFGMYLGFAEADLSRVCSAAMMHDIGKAMVPSSILNKPEQLTDDERRVIERHPVTGYNLLKASPGFPDEVLDVARHHHECLDGSGYPDGLKEGEISDLVRLVTIADIFAALIERRTYSPPMPRAKAYELLCKLEGKIDPHLAREFREVALNR